MTEKNLAAEPMGLGAVVEDANGSLWVSNRVESDIPWEQPWWCCDLSEYRDFRDIDVAHIRSRGYDRKAATR